MSDSTTGMTFCPHGIAIGGLARCLNCRPLTAEESRFQPHTQFNITCNCHDCTQARYKGSFQWQLDQYKPPEKKSDSGEPSREEPATLECVREKLREALALVQGMDLDTDYYVDGSKHKWLKARLNEFLASGIRVYESSVPAQPAPDETAQLRSSLEEAKRENADHAEIIKTIQESYRVLWAVVAGRESELASAREAIERLTKLVQAILNMAINKQYDDMLKLANGTSSEQGEAPK